MFLFTLLLGFMIFPVLIYFISCFTCPNSILNDEDYCYYFFHHLVFALV